MADRVSNRVMKPAFGWWTALYRYDPWADWRERHPCGGSATRVIRAKQYFFGGLALGGFGFISVAVTPGWFLLLCLALGAVLVVMAWREPTFAFSWGEPADLQPGHLYAPVQTKVVEGREERHVSGDVKPIMAVFKHHGRQRQVRVALAGGDSLYLTRTDQVAIAHKQDWFNDRRPVSTSSPEPRIDTVEMLPLLNYLWDLEVEGTAGMPLDEAVRDFTRHHVNLAVALGLLVLDQPRHRPHSVSLTGCGRIVVASTMRAAGREPYLDSEEKRMTYVNKGIYIKGSPGAAAVQGSGTATGGNAGGLDAGIVDLLHRLVARVGEMSSELEPHERDVVEVSADQIRQLLSTEQPDQGKLQRATRMILDRVEPIMLGAAGSGVWTGLALWARS